MLSITVIIPHLNQEAHLERCLAAIVGQTGTFSLDAVIVVDNGSRRMPEEVCARFDKILLLQELTPGPGPARNLGVAHADSPILAFIDADCVAAEGWLAAITAAFAADDRRAILGGDVRIPRAEGRRPTMIECYESVYAFRMKEYIEKQGFTGAGNLAVRAETMETVGEFGGLHIAEDIDWGRRATDMGIETTYVAEMLVYHPARETFGDLTLKWDRQIGHAHAELKGAGDRIKWVAKAILLAGSPLAEALRLVRTDRLSGGREAALAWLCVVRLRLHRARRMLSLTFAKDAERLSAGWNRD